VRGRAATLIAVCIGLAAPPLARAQIGGGDFGRPLSSDRPEGFGSPQSWAAELRFGPYRPDVDSEFSGRAMPYTEFFGTGSSFLFSIEVDYQLWHRFGSLAIGGSAGWFSDSAKACRPATCAQRVPGDESSINLIPLALLAVYRFDVPALKWNLPLVPYGKFGLAYDIWWFTTGNGDVATSSGGQDSARGGTFGIVAAGGLAFMLDWLDREAAVSLDGDLGINHTYLFFELYTARVNGLGQSNALHVGDTTWAAGLSFEF